MCFWKVGNSYPGWSERIRPDGWHEESDGNVVPSVKESVGVINLPDRTLTMRKRMERLQKIIWTGERS